MQTWLQLPTLLECSNACHIVSTGFHRKWNTNRYIIQIYDKTCSFFMKIKSACLCNIHSISIFIKSSTGITADNKQQIESILWSVIHFPLANHRFFFCSLKSANQNRTQNRSFATESVSNGRITSQQTDAARVGNERPSKMDYTSNQNVNSSESQNLSILTTPSHTPSVQRAMKTAGYW